MAPFFLTMYFQLTKPWHLKNNSELVDTSKSFISSCLSVPILDLVKCSHSEDPVPESRIFRVGYTNQELKRDRKDRACDAFYLTESSVRA